jgi:hypothetical protein
MPKPSIVLAALLALIVTTAAAVAADVGYKDYVKAGTFDDVSENLKDAIINRGYVIDYVGQFNKMLERTAADTGTITTGGNKSPYRNAVYMQFCPSKLTHEAVNASPFAIANCPIALFVYETNYEPGKVHVGYRLPVASPSKRVSEVNDRLTALLHEIASDATR